MLDISRPRILREIHTISPRGFVLLHLEIIRTQPERSEDPIAQLLQFPHHLPHLLPLRRLDPRRQFPQRRRHDLPVGGEEYVRQRSRAGFVVVLSTLQVTPAAELALGAGAPHQGFGAQLADGLAPLVAELETLDFGLFGGFVVRVDLDDGSAVIVIDFVRSRRRRGRATSAARVLRPVWTLAIVGKRRRWWWWWWQQPVESIERRGGGLDGGLPITLFQVTRGYIGLKDGDLEFQIVRTRG